MSTADDQGQTDGPPETPPGNGAPRPDKPGYGGPPREDEVSLLDILLVLARNKTIIVRTVLVFTMVGLTYAVFSPEKFTSSTEVVREAQEGGGNLSSEIPTGALSGLGVNLGGASSGLTPAAYLDVLQSREVRLAVVRDTFRFPDTERPMTYVEYMSQPAGTLSRVLEYTLWLPWTLKGALGRAISGSPAPAGTTETGELKIPTEEENAAMKTIGSMVSTTVSQETGLMTISVTADGPRLAADLTHSFLDHFTARVREIRTEKVRERLEFVEGRFQGVERELETAEEQLAQFLERNQNPTTATLQFQRDRLQRQVSFKEQLYSELQSQLTQTRLDLQRRRPVVTVVEEPVPPRQRSSPKRTFIVLVSLLVGGVIGVLGAFLRALFSASDRRPEERKKLSEIRDNLLPARWREESI